MGQNHDKPITAKVSRKDIKAFLLMMLKSSNELDLRGHYLEVRLIGKEGKPQIFFLAADAPDLEARLAGIAEQATKNRKNVYVGLALRNNDKSGKDCNCSMLTLLVVDYDEIDGVKIKDLKDYVEREAARNKILEWLQSEIDFPPTMIVDSGNGFHSYYALDSAINVLEQCEAIKRKSRWLVERYEQCPGDPAMLRLSQPIRLPDSYNVKNPDEPRLCKIVEYHPERVYSFADFPEADVKSVPKKRSLQVIRGPKARQSKKSVWWECAFLCWMLEHPAEQTYHLWMAAASTLAHFGEEGRTPFHTLSQDYSGYSENETDSMFDKMLASRKQGIGPITYKKLAEYGFDQRDNTNAASPAIYIMKLWQSRTMAEMGIGYGNKNVILPFNPNIFADYFLERNQILVYEDKVFYGYQGGLWRILTETQLKRKIRDMLHKVKKNMYFASLGAEAVDMIKLAAPEAKEMDTHKHLINLTNGILNINNHELLPHSPEYLSTVQIPLAYNPNAKCDRFELFVAEVMDNDHERIKVIQEWLGYLLTAETTIHKAFFLYGEGSNGKSLLLEIATMLIGTENVSHLTLQDLENSFRRSSLIGKTANVATENEISSKGFNTQYFKAIVSGDRIQVEKKYQDSISYSPICKLVYAVNNLPYSPDKTHGLYRRMLIIPFNRRFDGKKADKNLKKELQKELAGILNWALIGLKRLREQDYEFTASTVIDEAVSRYKHEQNQMLDYMTEMLVKAGQNDRVSRAKVMEIYQIWCRRNGLGDVVKMSPQKFWNTFRGNCKELGLPYEVQVSSGTRYLKRLVLKNIDEQSSQATIGVETDEDAWLA